MKDNTKKGLVTWSINRLASTAGTIIESALMMEKIPQIISDGGRFTF